MAELWEGWERESYLDLSIERNRKRYLDRGIHCGSREKPDSKKSFQEFTRMTPAKVPRKSGEVV